MKNIPSSNLSLDRPLRGAIKIAVSILAILLWPIAAWTAEEQDPLPALANLKRIHRETSAKYSELIIKFGPRDGRTLVAAKRIQDLNGRIAHYNRLLREQAIAEQDLEEHKPSNPPAPESPEFQISAGADGDGEPAGVAGDDLADSSPGVPRDVFPLDPPEGDAQLSEPARGVLVSDVSNLPIPQDDFGLVLSWTGNLSLSQAPNGKPAGISLAHGQIVKVIGRTGDWVRISTGPGVDGWVPAGAVSRQAAIPLPPPLPEIAPPPPPAVASTPKPAVVPPSPVKTTVAPPAVKPTVTVTKPKPVVDEIAENLDSALVSGNGKVSSTPGSIKGARFESNSPGKVVVAVPQRTQFAPENGVYKSSWCGPTSLGMIFEYYGIRRTTADIAKNTYNFKERNGTPSAKMAEEARKQGFSDSRVETGKTMGFLEETCRTGRPVIVNVDVSWKSGHYMVVVGVTADKVIVNDPGRTEVRREFDKAWFMSQWKGRDNRVVIIE